MFNEPDIVKILKKEEKLGKLKINTNYDQTEQSYKNMIENSPFGILTVDTKGFVRSCNNTFVKMAGYTLDELVGKNIANFPTLRKRDLPKYINLFKEIIKGDIPKPFEFIWEKKDGTIITSWIKQLQNDETIHCAADQILSFTYIKDIVRSVDAAIKNNLRGCYNISPLESFSRFELAKIVKKQLGIKKGKIVPSSINDFDFLDMRPKNTSLNSTKFIKATNFEFNTIQTCMDILKKSYI